MTQTASVTATATPRRVRGATKNFPLTPFKTVRALAEAIHREGVDGQLRRITAFDRIGKKPESSRSRQLVVDSARYGMTQGGKRSDLLAVTPDGARVVDGATPPGERLRIEFQLSVAHIDPFNRLYERLKDKKVPASDVLADAVTGVAEADRAKCAEIFLENAQYLGLIREEAGAQRIVPAEEILKESRNTATNGAGTSRPRQGSVHTPHVQEEPAELIRPYHEPTIHLDINVHIDSSASPEVVEQVFASMAKHIYRREAKNA